MTSKLEPVQEQLNDSFTFYREIREQIIDGNTEKIKETIKEIEEQLNSGVEFSSDKRFFMLSTVAKHFQKVSNYDKAGNYGRQAIRLSKKVSTEFIEVIIDTYLDYASLEREYGQLSNARMELAKLLAFLDTIDYKEPYAYGVIFSNLGKIALDEENMESGLTQLEKSLNYFKKAVSETHPIISSSIKTLSDAYIQVEHYHKAVELYQELLENYREAKHKVAEARTMLRLGEIHFYIDLKEARKIITNAIKLMSEIYKGNHLDIANAILMLAEIDENMSNFPRAINYYKQALQQLTHFYDETHFLVVYVYSKIGTISIKTFKLNQAKEYLEKGLDLSTQFPKIRMQFLYALGKIYSDEKAYDEAFEVFKEFLQRLEQDGRKKSIAYGNTLQAIAFNYLEQELMEEALVYYRNALGIYESLSNCKEEMGLTYIRLAYCYENIEDKDHQQAESNYEKGFKIIEKSRNQELLEEALAGIIDFFTRNENAKKRRLYEDKFVKLQSQKNKA
ncbi:tetratricopeptide repeat protein [Oceanobacillus halophilus]|uniref:Tetratricopeptide repeat protein n=1 Tax=Oceanobacillus halophilus TaxID=930130 RepID=A0A495AE55_9BACI|nr:tetratricopeptide repeat protein [Oceanobacillus halophilus]RKQ37235.1 tetratricopeptide repeat protein [Oceanobacillus halophilus]